MKSTNHLREIGWVMNDGVGNAAAKVAASICAASGICHAVFGFEDHASQLDSHCTVLISHERMAIRKQTCSE